MTDNYVVAIPSHNRVDTLRRKTYAFVKKHGFTDDQLNIFVSSPEEVREYGEAFPDCHIHSAPKGIGKTRNAIQLAFPEGINLLELDDDINSINQFIDRKSLKPINDFKLFVDTAFRYARKKGCGIWGVYPVNNPYFMRPDVTFDLVYIVGTCFGMVNSHDPALLVNIDDKEDFERSILWYIRDGKTLRFRNISVETDYWKEPGGLQSYRTKKDSWVSTEFLIRRYPQFAKVNSKKTVEDFAEVKVGDFR